MGLCEVKQWQQLRQGLTLEAFDHEVTVSEHSHLQA